MEIGIIKFPRCLIDGERASIVDDLRVRVELIAERAVRVYFNIAIAVDKILVGTDSPNLGLLARSVIKEVIGMDVEDTICAVNCDDATIINRTC